MNPTIQCVPNFSEGRDPVVIESIIDAARSISSARIIDYSSDWDHHRMVVTFLGSPEEISSAVLASARKAVELIDLRRHAGAHPRVGAVDVVPIVPVVDISMVECVDLSHHIGHEMVEALGVPVCFYEESATSCQRTNLSDIRRGGFERMCECGLTGDRAPDAGPCRVHPSAGLTVVGARGPLIAYNVNLSTEDMEVARTIVKSIRTGHLSHKGVKSMSVWLATQSLAQVSMNITRPDLTPIGDVFRFVRDEAQRLGVEVAESEIIGALRHEFLEGTSIEELRAVRFKDSQIIDNWL